MGQSRLPSVPGARYVQLHDWAVGEVGLAGAGVIGFLDFLDRNQARPLRPVATRLDISAALQGIAGRDAIDCALRDLVNRGWLVRSVHRLKNNPAEKFKFALNSNGICRFLADHEGGSEIRTPPSEIQDEFQAERQNNSNYVKEVEEEPQQTKEAEDGGGGDSVNQEGSDPIADKDNAKTPNSETNIIPNLASYIKGLNLDKSTVNRVFQIAENLPPAGQNDLLIVAQQKLPKANNAVAYLMTLARKAADGSLTIVPPDCGAHDANSQTSVDLMSDSEVAKQLLGKTAIFKGDECIAEVMHGSLYRNDRRYDISRVTKIMRAVITGELTLL